MCHTREPPLVLKGLARLLLVKLIDSFDSGIVTIVTFTESFENVSPIMSAPIGSVLLRKND